MSENPRQFSSIDSSDANLHGSLTNRPRSGRPVSNPIDLEVTFEVERRLEAYQKQKGTFVERTSEGEEILLKERQAARDAAWREQTKASKAAQELAQQREQAERIQLLEKTKGEKGTPHPYDTETERNTVRRLMGLPPVDEPPSMGSTPQRNPPPSPITPPPTPNTSGARVSSLVELTQTPSPAMQRQPMLSPPGQLEFQLPSPPPQMGRLLIPGAVNGAISTGARIIAGQPLEQAISGGVATAAGTVVGGFVGGALLGPVGAFVGGTVGGIIGGYISDQFFRQQIPSPSPIVDQYVPNYSPFTGGQEKGRLYVVEIAKFDLSGKIQETRTINVYGAIEGIKEIQETETRFQAFLVAASGKDEEDLGVDTSHWRITSIYRWDGQPDTGGNPAGHAPPPDNQPYRFDNPINNDAAVPSGTLSAGKNKGKNNDVAPKKPDGGSPRGSLPGTNSGDWVPGGYLAPSLFPSPEATPSNLGGMLPEVSPGQSPGSTPLATLNNASAPRIGLTITPSTGGFSTITPSTGGFSTVTPATVGYSEGTDADGNYISPTGQKFAPDGTPISKKDTNTDANTPPTTSPETKPPTAIADANSPIPKADTVPKVKTPEQTATDKNNETVQQQKKDFDQQIKRLIEIGGVTAGLTPIIQGIPDAIARSPTVQAANKETIQGAVCEIAQPSGCLGAPIKRAEDAANGNGTKLENIKDTLNNLGNLGQIADLGLLTIINNKLGEQLPGGIGGKLTRFAKWAHLDRAMNIMSLAASIHNAAMLSNNLSQTLFSVIGNMLSIIGLKNAEGEAFDIGSVISKGIEGLIKGAIGEDNYKALNANWKRANRIYQATANLLNSIQSLSASILSALEVIGQWNAKVANALKRFGVVGEKAYSWMNPNVNFQNKYFTALENATNVISQVDQVASEVLSIKETVGQITEQKKELDDSLKETDASKQKAELPEAAKLAEKESESKVASAALALAENDKEADEDS